MSIYIENQHVHLKKRVLHTYVSPSQLSKKLKLKSITYKNKIHQQPRPTIIQGKNRWCTCTKIKSFTPTSKFYQEKWNLSRTIKSSQPRVQPLNKKHTQIKVPTSSMSRWHSSLKLVAITPTHQVNISAVLNFSANYKLNVYIQVCYLFPIMWLI